MMKTLTTSLILSVLFLSAGAFAGSTHVVLQGQPDRQAENVTVIIKNGAWPPAGQISVEPCSYRRCIDI
jgi:hypothetical protein